MKFDLRLKAIFQDAMPGLLRMLQLPDVEEYLTVEFPKRSKSLPDLVVRLVGGCILHIELQAKNDSTIIDRCLDYRLVIRRQWPGAIIRQVVIYVGAEPVTMRAALDEEDLRFRFVLINLQDVPATTFLASESSSERALAVLCASNDPRETIVQILGSWKHLPIKELRDRIDSLGVLSQLRKRDKIVDEEADRMPIEIDITENAFYKRAMALGEARCEARGEARGEVRGEARAITRLLEKRFGKLPASTQARISSADLPTLDLWLDRLDTAAELDTIFAD